MKANYDMLNTARKLVHDAVEGESHFYYYKVRHYDDLDEEYKIAEGLVCGNSLGDFYMKLVTYYDPDVDILSHELIGHGEVYETTEPPYADENKHEVIVRESKPQIPF